jgi:hypothetical protein
MGQPARALHGCNLSAELEARCGLNDRKPAGQMARSMPFLALTFPLRSIKAILKLPPPDLRKASPIQSTQYALYVRVDTFRMPRKQGVKRNEQIGHFDYMPTTRPGGFQTPLRLSV